MEYSTSTENIYYDNDLQLAAELGKVLLERNKELESKLIEYQKGASEHDLQINLLTKQVEVLRHANDSRMRIYEEIDKSAQDLEKVNHDLRKQARAERSKVKGLNQTIESLEQRCDELQAKLEQMKRDMKKQKKERDQTGVRTWSVPSLNDAEFGFNYKGFGVDGYDYLGFPSLKNTSNNKRSELQKKEIKELKETVRIFKLQYAAEQKMRFDLERNVENLKQDNRSLIGKVKELEKEFEKQRELYKQAIKVPAKPESSPLCARCPSRAASVTGSDIGDGELLEHDLDELPRKQVVRLRCGGSAYGSRESLNQLGLEAVTPTLESCSDILVDAVQRNPSTADTPEETPTTEAPDPDNTLLGELEEQYRKLVKKYESLIETKHKRTQEASTQDASEKVMTSSAKGAEPVKLRRPRALGISKEVQTAWRKSSCGLDFTSPVNPVESSFHKGPPEYKRLFKEIFETLQQSTDFEGQTSPDK